MYTSLIYSSRYVDTISIHNVCIDVCVCFNLPLTCYGRAKSEKELLKIS